MRRIKNYSRRDLLLLAHPVDTRMNELSVSLSYDLIKSYMPLSPQHNGEMEKRKVSRERERERRERERERERRRGREADVISLSLVLYSACSITE